MTLYSRPYSFILPSGKCAHHFQVPPPEAAQAEAQAVPTKHKVQAWTPLARPWLLAPQVRDRPGPRWLVPGPLHGVILEPRSTLVSGRIAEKERRKQGRICSTVASTNGAGEHLGPIVAKLKPDDYIIQSPTAAARCEEVFRRIGAWMNKLGWQTEKAIHKFRAYAGCQVARRDGIEAASLWLRYHSIVVTQRHYGRYLRAIVTDAPLVIPTAQPFEPRIL